MELTDQKNNGEGNCTKKVESTLMPIFKETDDIQSCENYEEIKLMFERVVDSRLRQVVRIGRQQLGFVKELRTVNQKVLNIVFIDLEKAYVYADIDKTKRVDIVAKAAMKHSFI